MDKNTSDNELVRLCLANDKEAQYLLYKRYAGRMMTVCLRYAASRADAEDLLQEGFIKVFAMLKQFAGTGSLEGWIRSIIIHMAIRKWKQRTKMPADDIEEHFELHDQSISIIDQLSADELMKMIAVLPDGYRMVFNMYAVDGYSHAEIATATGIKESTSRSQLVKARLMLQKMILAVEETVKQK